MRALALISGGLDSILAAKLIQNQGIEIIPTNFKIPFCKKQDIASLIKEYLGLDLETIDISADFLNLLAQPKHGFGSNMNPCIDCKILMLQKAGQLLANFGAEFVVTGEVVGQRPMSQHRQALELIIKESGLAGLVVRPLCALLLPETVPEIKGWIKREKLLGLNGRSRKGQFSLAKEFKFEKFAQPAGGCSLTNPEFAKRIKDLIKHQELDMENVELLKIGRHFRISQEAKLIVGRNQKENNQLDEFLETGDYLFMPREDIAGPTALGKGKFDNSMIKLSSEIVARYCDCDKNKEINVFYRHFQAKDFETSVVEPAPEKILSKFRI
jgi:tRNA U34 2-thiouridine synthase MnmA/TrmU